MCSALRILVHCGPEEVLLAFYLPDLIWMYRSSLNLLVLFITLRHSV